LLLPQIGHKNHSFVQSLHELFLLVNLANNITAACLIGFGCSICYCVFKARAASPARFELLFAEFTDRMTQVVETALLPPDRIPPRPPSALKLPPVQHAPDALALSLDPSRAWFTQLGGVSK
jgi:hypothetical protein